MSTLRDLHALQAILDMLELLLPGFHTLPDHADLTEARACIADVRARLEHEIAEDAVPADEAWRPWISVTDSPYRYAHVEIIHPERTRPVIIRTIMIDPIYITPALRWRPLPGARPLS